MAFFSDGTGSIGAHLPNARLVSSELFGVPPFSYNKAQIAFMAAAWGKIVLILTLYSTSVLWLVRTEYQWGIHLQVIMPLSYVYHFLSPFDDPFCTAGQVSASIGILCKVIHSIA